MLFQSLLGQVISHMLTEVILSRISAPTDCANKRLNSLMGHAVPLQVRRECVASVTLVTFKWLFPRMHSHMGIKARLSRKTCRTKGANQRPIVGRVRYVMILKIALRFEPFLAYLTLEAILFDRVRFYVLAERVLDGKRFRTNLTNKRPLTLMASFVIREGTFIAEYPATLRALVLLRSVWFRFVIHKDTLGFVPTVAHIAAKLVLVFAGTLLAFRQMNFVSVCLKLLFRFKLLVARTALGKMSFLGQFFPAVTALVFFQL